MTIHHDRFMERVTAPQGIWAAFPFDPSSRSAKVPTRNTAVRMVEYRGEMRRLRDLCRAHGIDYTTVSSRLRRGLSIEKALAEPIRMSNLAGWRRS